MNKFQVPANLGRIPEKIYCGKSFSNFTANQWRIFISIYATVVLWEYLEEVDKIHKKIVDVVTLIEKKYGRNVITPNFHLSLHLSVCSHDFGPLYVFWCFSFERMNGILGLLPNSHQQIEPELMCRLINDNRINEMIYTENNTKGLEILNTRQSVGSLSEIDQFGHDEMRRFWIYSRTIQESTISGKESFPGKMLKPFSENIPLSADGILDLMIAYYNDIYENLKFQKLFETDSLNSIIIPLKINKYYRCRIGSEIFGSTFSPRHQKSSYILAKFASEDDSINIYPGQIQFFFVHEIKQIYNVELWNTEFYPKSRDCIIPVHHILGWLTKFASEDDSINIYPGQIQFFFVHEIKQIYNVELWNTEFYPKSRDCIIPVHHILGWLSIKFQIIKMLKSIWQ
ncbi:hypothetical protein Glove_554g9 [Diversispora epigaea]|uniref:DUF4218 domain-containing protein n=1 Tax=Diversispora epigaea TaxID=1348612 RepID=A0A397GDP9_9GLOM|nr:hypothetical protein Glove_554g9 [Diversispora epigaea]